MVKKELIGLPLLTAPPLSDYPIRASLSHTIKQVVELILLKTEERDAEGNALFYPIFISQDTPVDELRTLGDVLNRQLVLGTIDCPELRLYCDYSPSRQRVNPIAEEFFVAIFESSSYEKPLISCRETLFSTVKTIKGKIQEKLGIPAEKIKLTFGLETAKDDSTLMELLAYDVAPLEIVPLILYELPPQATETTRDDLLKTKLREESSQLYSISANGATVELSSMDCFLHPDGFLLLNSYAQEVVKRKLLLTELCENPPRSQSSQYDLSPLITTSTFQNDTQLNEQTTRVGLTQNINEAGNQRLGPETLAQQIRVESASQQNIPEAHQVPEEPNEHRNQAADAAADAAADGDENITWLLFREISANIDEIAQLFVRLVLSSALMGPQRAFYLLQPPLIYFLLVFILWVLLFFYGCAISEWIEAKLLHRGPQDRIDYTITKLVSQIFCTSYALTTFVTEVACTTFNYLEAGLHYNRLELDENRGFFLWLKITVYSIVEFFFVLAASIFPVLGNEAQVMCEVQPISERKEMQLAIDSVLKQYDNSAEIRAELRFEEVAMDPETLLAPGLGPHHYEVLIDAYKQAKIIQSKGQSSPTQRNSADS